MRRSIAALGLVSALAGGAAILSTVPSVETLAAAGGETFVIPANDGYGIAECVTSGSSSCGQVVADAWCEAQGFARSASFGPADIEVTGSIGASSRPISVTCRN